MYDECIALVAGFKPINTWEHKPSRVTLKVSQRRAFGQAHSFGMVGINDAYIGTRSTHHLKDTILHELAHLAVGLNQGHNSRFKRFLSRINPNPCACPNELRDVRNNMGFKYSLLAFCETTIYDTSVFSKSKMYTTYTPTADSYRLINDEKVLRFEYIPFGDPLPDGTISEVD
jgi:predicted SprT family Zn-dependent metalloprotease